MRIQICITLNPLKTAAQVSEKKHEHGVTSHVQDAFIVIAQFCTSAPPRCPFALGREKSPASLDLKVADKTKQGAPSTG
jgi:hypothetical protein